MRFIIRAFEEDNTPPVEGAHKERVNYCGKEMLVWFVEFNTLDELMNFAGKRGPIVINPGFPSSIVVINA